MFRCGSKSFRRETGRSTSRHGKNINVQVFSITSFMSTNGKVTYWVLIWDWQKKIIIVKLTRNLSFQLIHVFSNFDEAHLHKRASIWNPHFYTIECFLHRSVCLIQFYSCASVSCSENKNVLEKKHGMTKVAIRPDGAPRLRSWVCDYRCIVS